MSDVYVTLPHSIENLSLPDPELLTFYKDLEHRCFWTEYKIIL